MTKKLFNFVRNNLIIFFTIMFLITGGCHAEPAIWNVPQENHHFVGRDDIFEKIKTRLKSPNQELVVIKGPQGFGKTQIAKRFVYKYFKKYDVVWWFRANQYLQPQFEKFVESMAAYLKSENIFNTVVKGKDFDDLCALYEQIIYLAIDMKDEALAYNYWTKILETYGANHPRVVKAMLTLDQNGLYFGV